MPREYKGSGFTTRHYETIAKLLGRINEGGPLSANDLKFVRAFVALFSEDNPNFDEDRFYKRLHSYSGVTPEEQEVEA